MTKDNNNYYQIFYPGFLFFAASIYWTLTLLLDYNPLRLVTSCPLHLNVLRCSLTWHSFSYLLAPTSLCIFLSLLLVYPLVVLHFFPLACLSNICSMSFFILAITFILGSKAVAQAASLWKAEWTTSFWPSPLALFFPLTVFDLLS